MRDKIIIKGMDFFGYHGLLEEEKVLGQRFIVDLELFLSLEQAGSNDDLSLSINYAEVFSVVSKIVREDRFLLIEALAESIANTLLTNYPLNAVLVQVKKPQAPIPGIFDYVAVEIYREASNG